MASQLRFALMLIGLTASLKVSYDMRVPKDDEGYRPCGLIKKTTSI